MASWNSACTLARSPRLSLVGILAAMIKGKREGLAVGLRCVTLDVINYVHNFVRGGKVAISFATTSTPTK